MKYAALSIIMATSLAACGKPAPAPAPEPTALVRTAPAASQALDEQITLYGQAELDPAAVRTLTANYEARVEAIHVAVGESVASGQPIATLRRARRRDLIYNGWPERRRPGSENCSDSCGSGRTG